MARLSEFSKEGSGGGGEDGCVFSILMVPTRLTNHSGDIPPPSPIKRRHLIPLGVPHSAPPPPGMAQP